TRHIPRKVKDLVYRRDGGRCSFVSRSGRRCSSRWNLQYDHIVPYGKGGGNSPDNLRLLCARHNRLMAEREYGPGHIRQFSVGK
ncbi:MAG: HNH endonuclease, partial [Candidatus Latescibacteria bacterium]|nr:HNH endonuclease [bacterium]MBD3423277.1 HNH endonuclease [Candidatus Latescibacterota bacterium]